MKPGTNYRKRTKEALSIFLTLVNGWKLFIERKIDSFKLSPRYVTTIK